MTTAARDFGSGWTGWSFPTFTLAMAPTKRRSIAALEQGIAPAADA